MKKFKFRKLIFAVIIACIFFTGLFFVVSTAFDETTPIEFSKDYSIVLTKGEKNFSFSLDAPSVIKYVLKTDKPSSDSVTAVLYAKYYVNGVSGKQKLRQINLLSLIPGSDKSSSPEIGLSEGDYVITVKSKSAEPFIFNANRNTVQTGTVCEIECNDTVTRYTEIYPGVPVRGSASYSSGSTYDEDWFMFRLFEHSKINLIFEHEEINLVGACWNVEILDAFGNSFYRQSSSFSSEITDSGNLGLSAGCYFIRINALKNIETGYKLLLTADNGDGFETENNDTFSSAEIIKPDVDFRGALTMKVSGADRDYFKGKADSDSKLSVRVSLSNNTDKAAYRVSVFDKDRNRICFRVIPAGVDSFVLPSLGISAGEFYILLDNDNLSANNSEYKLNYSLEKTDGFETESNDTASSADSFNKNGMIQGLISTKDDTDFYSFSVSSGKKLSVELTHGNKEYSENLFCFSVVNADGIEFEGFDSLNNSLGTKITASSKTVFYSLPNGKYFVKVAPGRFLDANSTENPVYTLILK